MQKNVSLKLPYGLAKIKTSWAPGVDAQFLKTIWMSDISDGNKVCGDMVQDEKEDLALQVIKIKYAVMTDDVAVALIGSWIFKDNFASTFKLLQEGRRHHAIICYSLYLYWVQTGDLHVNLSYTKPHILCYNDLPRVCACGMFLSAQENCCQHRRRLFKLSHGTTSELIHGHPWKQVLKISGRAAEQRFWFISLLLGPEKWEYHQLCHIPCSTKQLCTTLQGKEHRLQNQQHQQSHLA